MKAVGITRVAIPAVRSVPLVVFDSQRNPANLPTLVGLIISNSASSRVVTLELLVPSVILRTSMIPPEHDHAFLGGGTRWPTDTVYF
jgi:hypothetical protein